MTEKTGSQARALPGLVKALSNKFWDIADRSSCNNSLFAKLYNNRIDNEYRKEFELCHIDPQADVLHIGCGAYPLTEIHLAEVTKGSITGIDRNQQVVQKATECITRRQLSGRIHILHGNGLTHPLKDFDTIIVSSCSTPKLQLIERIIQDAQPNTQIILREVELSCGPLLTYFSTRHDVSVLSEMRHNPPPFFPPLGWVTYHIQKK
jgi:2-polyprenyl-3-methyl-5-hydroxy-6-metoxy-1,4-benzoquinol methylase